MLDSDSTSRSASTEGNGAAQLTALRSRDGDLRAVLDEIVERASRPLERAQAFPPAAYTNEELYELEVERIWRRSWIYACREEELAKAGDWVSLDVVGEPVMAVRTDDGTIRAFSRICPHRFMDVLDNDEGRRGNSKAFVCPYHAWTFGLDGKLATAPLMDKSELYGERKDGYCLREMAVSTWQGFVMVNLDPDAAPLDESELVSEVEDLLGNYDLAEWRLVRQIDWGEVHANWKIVVDNGREAYHHLGLHKDSVEPLWPAHMFGIEPTESPDFWFGRMFVCEEAATGKEDGHLLTPLLLPPAPGLTPFERSNYAIFGIYPGLIVVPGPDFMYVLSYVPTGVSTHKFNIDMLVHESVLDHPDLEQAVEEGANWISEIQAEDAKGQLGLQRMIEATRYPLDGGALSHLERPVWTFQRYIATKLTGVSLNGQK